MLHDQLHWLFEHHPDLTPADVVVMTPDIDAYAPCIEAVFGGARAARRIPFTIADRSLRAESPLVEAFLGAARPARQPLRGGPAPGAARHAGGAPPLRDRGAATSIWCSAGARERRALGRRRRHARATRAAGRPASTPGASASTACCSATRCRAATARLRDGVLPCDAVEGSDAQVARTSRDVRRRRGGARGDARRAALDGGLGRHARRRPGALRRARRRRGRTSCRRCAPRSSTWRTPPRRAGFDAPVSLELRPRAAARRARAAGAARALPRRRRHVLRAWCRCAASPSRSCA